MLLTWEVALGAGGHVAVHDLFGGTAAERLFARCLVDQVPQVRAHHAGGRGGEILQADAGPDRYARPSSEWGMPDDVMGDAARPASARTFEAWKPSR
jgi:hypothetical protein